MRTSVLALLVMMLAGFGLAIAQPVPQLTIREVQGVSDSLLNLNRDASPRLGQTVWVRGVVATAPRTNPSGPYLWFTGDRWRFLMRDPSDSTFNWITVVASDSAYFRDSVGIDQLIEGDSVEVLGQITEYRTLTQLEVVRSDTSLRLLGVSSEPFEPVDLPVSAFFTGTTKVLIPGEYYESALVRLQSLTVIGTSGAEFTVADAFGNRIIVDDQSDLIFNGPPPPSPGASIETLTGAIFTNSSLGWTISPRSPSDYTVQGYAATITDLGRTVDIPGPSDAVAVRAQIVHKTGSITSARVFYSVNGVNKGPLVMTSMPDSIYEATLPPTVVDSAVVRYYFAATDNNNVTICDPPDTTTTRHFYLALNRIPGIRDIQFNPYGGGSSYEGRWVIVNGIATSDRRDYGAVFVQEGTGPWSGILILAGADSTIRRGDDLTVIGRIWERFDQTCVDSATFVTNSTGNPVPDPTSVLAENVRTGGSQAEAYESVLIQTNNVYVVNINEDAISNSNFGEWGAHETSTRTSGLRVDDFSNHLPYANDTGSVAGRGKIQLHVGDFFESIRGVLYYSFNHYKLIPRDAGDFTGYVVSSVELTSQVVPEAFTLFQNYPNPFNPSTTIEYALPNASKVRLAVYNLLGQEVAVLVDDVQEAGTYRVRLDASALSRASSGVYFYHLSAGEFSVAKKMVLIR